MRNQIATPLPQSPYEETSQQSYDCILQNLNGRTRGHSLLRAVLVVKELGSVEDDGVADGVAVMLASVEDAGLVAGGDGGAAGAGIPLPMIDA